MSAHPPKLRPAPRLLAAAIALTFAVVSAAPATALPGDFAASALRNLAAWFGNVGRDLLIPGDPTDPNAGTCIDPNGKPKPCEVIHIIPGRAGREPERPLAPR